MKSEDLLTIDSFGSLKGKTILLRVDINSPIDFKTLKITSNPRIQAHSKTILLLSSKGAKVVVLAHQGRKGGDDFFPLEEHAKLISKLIKKPVIFHPDTQVVSEKTLEQIKKLKDGQIMLLDNVRYLDEETAKLDVANQTRTPLVNNLAPLMSIYVDDAFSNAHRAHISMTGFPAVLPSAAGPVMLSELESAKKAAEPSKRPAVFLMGGAKPEEIIGIMKHALENSTVDKILTAGLIGELCVIARGSSLTENKMKWLKEKGYDKHLLPLREVMHSYHEFIETPFDFAILDKETGKRREIFLTTLSKEIELIGDIGKKTYTKYSKILAKAKTIYVKGPCGIYEDEEFQEGTRTTLTAVANNAGAYSLVAGGNTSDAFEKLKIPQTNIGHLSIGGGVLLEYLAGTPLPAIIALQESAKNFGTELGYHPYVAKPVEVEEEKHSEKKSKKKKTETKKATKQKIKKK